MKLHLIYKKTEIDLAVIGLALKPRAYISHKTLLWMLSYLNDTIPFSKMQENMGIFLILRGFFYSHLGKGVIQ